MKISTEIASAARRVGEERTIEYLARAGFDAFDFSMFDMCKYDRANQCLLPNEHPLAKDGWREFALRLKEKAAECGIHCNQSHAPFPTSIPSIRDYMKRSIEATAVAGGDICIIHPFNNGTVEENAEFYRTLLPFAREHGVKIATENMWCWNKERNEACFAACATPESFVGHIDAVNDKNFIACLDIGHAEMKGIGTTAPELISALGDRLGALHIHDNDKWHDSHQIPFSMDIDFEAVIDALVRIDYKGYLTLEADMYLSSYETDSIYEGIKNLAESAKRLADMFEEKKSKAKQKQMIEV